MPAQEAAAFRPYRRCAGQAGRTRRLKNMAEEEKVHHKAKHGKDQQQRRDKNNQRGQDHGQAVAFFRRRLLHRLAKTLLGFFGVGPPGFELFPK